MIADGAKYRYTHSLSPALNAWVEFACGGFLWLEWADPESGDLMDAPYICFSLSPRGDTDDVIRLPARDVLLDGTLEVARWHENWEGTLTFEDRAQFERYNAANEYMARWFELMAEQIRSRKLNEEDLTPDVWQK